MKRIILIILLISAIQIYSQEKLTLDSCYKWAEKYFPTARQLNYNDSLSNLRILNNSAQYLPDFSLFGQAQYQSDVTKLNLPPAVQAFGFNVPTIANEQYKIGVNVNQLIWDGGIISVMNSIDKLQNDITKKSVSADLYKIREQINNIFFGILVIRENSKLLKLAASDLDNKLKTIESGVKNGVIPESNSDILKAELIKISQKLNELSAMEASSIYSLGELTGRKFQIDVDLDIPVFDNVSNKLDVGKRYEFEIFDLTKSSLEESKSLANSKLLPKFAAYFQGAYSKPGLNMFDPDWKFYYIAGVKASWNLWNWNVTERETEIAEVKKEIVDSQKEAFTKTLKIAAVQYLNDIQRLQGSIKQDDNIIELKNKVAKEYSSRLDNGVITSTEYLTEYNSAIQAQLNKKIHSLELTKAIANYYMVIGE